MRTMFTSWTLAVGVIGSAGIVGIVGIAGSAGIVGIAGPPAIAADRPVLEEGEPFPDIKLPSMYDGRPMSIADFRGQKVVLHVFASW